MNEDRFREIALGFEGAVESSHMGHPDFRVAAGKSGAKGKPEGKSKGRIFATLTTEGDTGVVKLTPEQQAARLAFPGFEPAPGAWGKRGYTRIVLAAARVRDVKEALGLAWEHTAKER